MQPIALLLAIDSVLSDSKQAANELLAKQNYRQAVETYRSTLGWFRDLKAAVAEIKPTAAERQVEELDSDEDELEDVTSKNNLRKEKLSLKVIKYVQSIIDNSGSNGILYSSDNALVRALVTVVDGDAEGTFSLVMSTHGLPEVGSTITPEAAANIGSSILLSLMAHSSNLALASLKLCEWEQLPRTSGISQPSMDTPPLPPNAVSLNGSHSIIEAVVSARLVPTLIEAVADADRAAILCDKTAQFILTTLEAGSSSGAIRSPSAKASLLAVCAQLLVLGMKLRSRGARMLVMLADVEELQLLEYFTRGMNTKPKATGDLVSKVASASAKRRYQFLLKAWSGVREAVASNDIHLASWRKLQRAAKDDASTNTSEAAVLSALSHLRTNDEAKYRSLVCLEESSGPSVRSLSHQVAPFISKIHGIGLMSVAPVEDGDLLLHEAPMIQVSGDGFEERFSQAVTRLKELVLKCRVDLKQWWAKVQAADAKKEDLKAGDVIPSLSNAFGLIEGEQRSSAPLLVPRSFYSLISLLALHTESSSDGLFEGEEGELGEEDTLLCSAWHHNAMRIDEMDFRVGGGELHASGGEGAASGLYLIGSRLNHSIRRINAVCMFDVASRQLSVRALAKIPAGKEIFISYAPLIESYLNQKRHLRFDTVRELQRKPIYNTEDGSIPEGKPVPDATLLEDENETGQDVLAPHLFGLELIHCPQCRIEIEGKRTVATIVDIKCNVCKTMIPVASYYESIEQRRQVAVGLCSSQGADAPPNRAKAVKVLIGVEDGATMLGKNHYLRAQIRMEALAAAVGAQLSEDLSARLVHLSRLTAERVTGLCPPSWPLTTGLKMHYVYCMGRHRIGTNTTQLSDFVGLVARDSKLDPNRTNVKFEDEAPLEYTADLINEQTDVVNRRVLRFIFLSMQDHVVQHGPDGAMTSFMERYRPELESVGIQSPEGLEKAIKMAAITVCR